MITSQHYLQAQQDKDPIETQEWELALEDVIREQGIDRAYKLINTLIQKVGNKHERIGSNSYTNTLYAENAPTYPGNLQLEEKLENIIRWNALVMVLRAQLDDADLGGHLSTYASIATLYEVGFLHFWKAGEEADFIYFQGHSSPGIYARSFLEYRFNENHLAHFRRETEGKGLSSYPHPWLMPNYWQFPTVSMGLGPLQAIYQAKYLKYVHSRGQVDTLKRKVWCFCGDGEMDETESLGALSVASREKLNNLIFVVNCNLQRLDGPVRGNGNIVKELEAVFTGAGWKVIKVLWNSHWDPLLDADENDVLRTKLSQTCDGEFQNHAHFGGEYIKEHFFADHPELIRLKNLFKDQDWDLLNRGGHDRKKVYQAYQEAVNNQDEPVVILAQTVKGYGLGKQNQAFNTAHNTKKLQEATLIEIAERLQIPLSEEEVKSLSFYRPNQSDEIFTYLKSSRENLGGYLPARKSKAAHSITPDYNHKAYEQFNEGTQDKKISTTMAFVRILSSLLKDPSIKDQLVPIVADEARTFGMEGLFKQIGIYSSKKQQYQPVDHEEIMSYKESTNGQLLQEGINEAGAMSSWIAAATSYSTLNHPMIPLYIYYSMFGFQRIGDLCWAAGDMRARGILLGATAGRTTLNGEGLQHQDGHSHLIASTIPNARCYDPAFAFEVAVILKEAIRSISSQEDVFFYITLMNEPYTHPVAPTNSTKDIIKGMYLLYSTGNKPKIDLLGSGTILNEVLAAADRLKSSYNIDARVWSVTSYTELRREALAIDHSTRLDIHESCIKNHIQTCLDDLSGPIVAASDYMKLIPDQIRTWIKRPYVVLGTDGYGRSDTRRALRQHFEVSQEDILFQALKALQQQNQHTDINLDEVCNQLKLDRKKLDPISL